MSGHLTKRMVLRAWIPAALGITLIVTVVLVAALNRGTSSTTSASLTTYTRTTDNYRLGASKDAVRGRDAPGMAVDPGDPTHVVEINVDRLSGECYVNVSRDAGRTWKGGTLKAPSGYPGKSPCDTSRGQPFYPSVSFGSGQNVYIAWNAPSTTSPNNRAALVSRSTDGASTFSTAVVAMAEGHAPAVNKINPGPTYRSVTLAVQPGAGTAGGDRIALTAQDNGCRVAICANGDVFATGSDDSGATWSTPVQVNKPLDPAGNAFGIQEPSQVVMTSADHWFVAWRTRRVSTASAQDPRTADGFIRVGQSTDRGKTWTEVDATPVRGAVYTGPVVRPYSKTPTAFDSSNFPRLAVDRASGHLYLTWNQGSGLFDPTTGALLPSPYAAADHFIDPTTAVWFMSSADGTTWSGRHEISDATAGGLPVQTRQPNISVASDGRIDIVWNDRRAGYNACTNTHVACPETRLGDTYTSSSPDGGKSWSANRRVTDRSLDLDVGYDHNAGSYWSFGPVSVPLGPSQFLVAWMDSREGNYDTQNQDIYLSVVPVTASGTVPVTALNASTADDLSAALSRLAHPGGSEDLLTGGFNVKPATQVVIVNDKDAAGILAGGVLARANVGPLLVSPASGLPSSVTSEVKRLSAVGAYVIGSTAELSKQVETDLAAAGVPAEKITRISGADAATTATLIAAQMDRRTATDKAANTPAFDTVVIAMAGSPDAAAVSTLAVNRRLPVLYVDQATVPQVTSDTLTALHINKALVIGGTSVIGDAVLTQLTSAGVTPTRLGGADPEATSMQVARESLKRGLPANQVFVANGENPLQGDLLGASTGRLGGLLLLTRGGSTSDALAAVASLGIDAQLARLVASSADTW